MALIESATAQQLLECCDESDDEQIVLDWDGAKSVVPPFVDR